MWSEMGELERIKAALGDVESGEPMTAREILRVLDEHDEDFESAHRVATVLGRWAERGEVEVIPGQPYRYRLES